MENRNYLELKNNEKLIIKTCGTTKAAINTFITLYTYMRRETFKINELKSN